MSSKIVSEAAAAMGRRCLETMTPEQRKERAKKASIAGVAARKRNAAKRKKDKP